MFCRCQKEGPEALTLLNSLCSIRCLELKDATMQACVKEALVSPGRPSRVVTVCFQTDPLLVTPRFPRSQHKGKQISATC